MASVWKECVQPSGTGSTIIDTPVKPERHL